MQLFEVGSHNFCGDRPGAQTHAYREIVRTNFRYFVILAITKIMMHCDGTCIAKVLLVQVDRVVTTHFALKITRLGEVSLRLSAKIASLHRHD